MQPVSVEFGGQSDPSTFLPKVKDRPLAGFLHEPHGAVELLTAITATRRKHVPGQALGMNPHQHRLVVLDRLLLGVQFADSPAAPRDVWAGVTHGLIGHDGERAEFRRKLFERFDPFYDSFALLAIFDQRSNGAHLQPVGLGERDELRSPGHLAVFRQNRADHAGRLKPGQPRQVDGRFGMPGSHQHAALTRP